jgi:nucleoside-diphosphate-sugar epimerase
MTTPPQPLHVIFGTGPVGLSIMDELLTREVQIRLVNRSGNTSEPLPEAVELINGDASDPDFATRAATGAAVIYFALNPPYHKWSELFPGLQAGVLAAAEATGAKLVVMENVYMYGDTDGAPLHESLPHNAHTRKGKLRAQMHQDLMQAHQAERVRVVVGRASDFFGPRTHNSTAGDSIFGKAANGQAAQLFGDPDQPHTYTYMPDIGRGLVALAEDADAYGQVWHLPNPQTVSTREFVQRAYAHFDADPQFQVIPTWMIRVLGVFIKPLGEMPEMMYEFEKPFIVASDAFEAHFGFGATPLDDGIRQTAAWFRANNTPNA